MHNAHTHKRLACNTMCQRIIQCKLVITLATSIKLFAMHSLDNRSIDNRNGTHRLFSCSLCINACRCSGTFYI